MAALSTNRHAWEYTDSKGNVWRVAAQKALTDQGVLGGVAAGPTIPQRPVGYKMRRTTVSDGAGHSRVVPVYSATADIITPGTAINVNVLGTSTAMTSIGGYVQEDIPKQNVTKQSD